MFVIFSLALSPSLLLSSHLGWQTAQHRESASPARSAELGGIRTELPIAVGVVPFGMIYGVLALAAGLPMLRRAYHRLYLPDHPSLSGAVDWRWHRSLYSG